jgi:CheY-like chemotaxis protein
MPHEQILVIDDNKDYAQSVKEFLESSGYIVQIALNEEEARQILESAPVALAIVDVRLRNNVNEQDMSGVNLARGTAPHVPKLILTDHPTWEAVRRALGSAPNGRPPAVGFVAKKEGLEALLAAVNLALLRRDAVFTNKLHQAFGATEPIDLQQRIKEMGPAETTRRLQQSFDATAAELTQQRDRESNRASHLHTVGLIASVVGIGLILAAATLVIWGSIAGGVLSLVASGITQAIRMLFSVREDAAHKRVQFHYEELNEINRISTLIAIADSFKHAADSDRYRKKIIDHILEKGWLVASAEKKRVKKK